MDSEIELKVVNIVATVKQVPADAIRLDATFDELGIDSLDRINILFEIESEFNIDIPDEEARAINSVSGIVARLGDHLLRADGQKA